MQVNMCIPDHVVRSHVAKHVASNSIGYRHMLRFYALMLASHPALAPYQYMMRMDCDSLLVSPLENNPFTTLAKRNALYGYVMLWRDTPELIRGLDRVRRCLRLGLCACGDAHSRVHIDSSPAPSGTTIASRKQRCGN